MKELIATALRHITRDWSEDERPPHPRLRIVPPFIIEALAYLLAVAVTINLVSSFFR